MPQRHNKDVLDRAAAHLLRRAMRMSANLYEAGGGKRNLTQRQYELLALLDASGETTQKELSRLTGFDRSTLSELVNRLVEKGYVGRRPWRQDRRVRVLRIRAEGRRAMRVAEPFYTRADRELMNEVKGEHRRAFLAGLRAISRALARHEARAARETKPAKPARTAKKEASRGVRTQPPGAVKT